MKLYTFFILIIFLFSCSSYSEKVLIEKKSSNYYEIKYRPFYIFHNNGKEVYSVELVYLYPNDFFYMKITPDNKKSKLFIDKIILRSNDTSSDLQVYKLKNKDSIQKNKLITQVTKLTYEDFKKLFDLNQKVYLIINDKEKELKFFIEIYDKEYLNQFDQNITKFKKEIGKVKGLSK